MNYQTFTIELIEKTLNLLKYDTDKFEKDMYKYAIANGIVGQYAETYYINKTNDEFKFWNVNFHTNKFKGKEVWNNIFASKEAIEICKQIETNNIKVSKKDGTAPFYEHIEPRSVTYHNLIELISKDEITKENIKSILDCSKLVILTYEQKDFLDKTPYNNFDENDENLIIEWHNNKKISKEACENAIKSIKNDSDEYISSQMNGTSYARFAHICNKCPESEFGRKGIYAKGKDAIDIFNEYINDTCKNI